MVGFKAKARASAYLTKLGWIREWVFVGGVCVWVCVCGGVCVCVCVCVCVWCVCGGVWSVCGVCVCV